MNSRTVVGNVIINTRGRIIVELGEPRLVSLGTMPMGEERKLGKGALVKRSNNPASIDINFLLQFRDDQIRVL